MAKAPMNVPSEGDRVMYRKNGAVGKLSYHNRTNDWCRVTWDTENAGPRTCHLFELAKEIENAEGTETKVG